jgi:APA family basic amino acid/polyamine antiporter
MKQGPQLGLLSGIGLVASSMIGVGVLVSAGWAASVLDPGEILLAWLVGGFIALCGARAYAALAELIPRSGGEYRYLSDLLHPVLGSMAGWASLFLGFAAPVAFCAAMADAYASTLVPLPEHSVGIAIVVGVTALGMCSARATQRVQDALALAKIALFALFLAVGAAAGSHAWPTWTSEVPHDGFPLQSFVAQLLWVAVAYTGWNTAAYASEEFREPRRDVPRAMLIGTLIVTALYLAVNWVFVANLDTATLAQWRAEGGDAARTTLGHLIVRELAGPTGAAAMSAFVVLAMISSTSAFTVAGPRVYAAMADDGALPRVFAARSGTTPAASTLLQGTVALALLLTHSFDLLVENVGAALTFTTALAALALLRARLRPPQALDTSRLGLGPLTAAALYFLASTYTLLAAALERPSRLLWIALLLAVAAVTHRTRRRA